MSEEILDLLRRRIDEQIQFIKDIEESGKSWDDPDFEYQTGKLVGLKLALDIIELSDEYI